jgi:hypothetical protein
MRDAFVLLLSENLHSSFVLNKSSITCHSKAECICLRSQITADCGDILIEITFLAFKLKGEFK